MMRNGDATLLQSAKLGFEHADAVPLDEGTQQVDLVGRVELCAQFGAEGRLIRRIGQKGRIGQGSLRSHRRSRGDLGDLATS